LFDKQDVPDDQWAPRGQSNIVHNVYVYYHIGKKLPRVEYQGKVPFTITVDPIVLRPELSCGLAHRIQAVVTSSAVPAAYHDGILQAASFFTIAIPSLS
jgi:hypothetical protein